MLRAPRCPECGLIFRWQALLDVSCPRCAEPLGKVDQDTCPRCQLRLEWPALLDAAAALDRSLYEYSDRPARAALRTWFAALNPWRFWKRIPLESPPAVSRLRRLRGAAMAICLVSFALVSGLRLQRQAWFLSRAAPLDIFYFMLPQVTPFALAFTLPLVTLVGLPRFTPTLLSFRVRREQLLRCFCYAGTGLFWIGAVYCVAFAAGFLVNLLWPPAKTAPLYPDCGMFFDYLPDSGFWAWRSWAWSPATLPLLSFNVLLSCTLIFFGLAWWWVFLYLSLRRYLRLDRSNTWVLFLSTQLIGLLLMLLLLISLGTGTRAVGAAWWWLGSKFGLK
jgi:hypothetical protein